MLLHNTPTTLVVIIIQPYYTNRYSIAHIHHNNTTTTMSQTVQVKSSTGDKYSITVDSSDITVLQLKQDLEKQCNIPAAEQRLIYKGTSNKLNINLIIPILL